MSTRNFRDLIEGQFAKGKFVCVGLDPEYDKLPKFIHKETVAYGIAGCSQDAQAVIRFCRDIVDTTADIACAYKLNSGYFEAQGIEGPFILREVAKYIKEVAPHLPVILDAKRGDIGNTNVAYVESAFERIGADAITVHPYLGKEALQPFLDQGDKGIIVLCRTSNKGAGEFQDLSVHIGNKEHDHLMEVGAIPRSSGISCATTDMSNHVAYQVSKHWNVNGNCLLVVGATFPAQLESVRRIVGDMPLLIPGIGAQGGDLEETVKAGKDSRNRGMVINSSRGIIFASNGEDFAEAARREARKLHDAITKCLEAPRGITVTKD